MWSPTATPTPTYDVYILTGHQPSINTQNLERPTQTQFYDSCIQSTETVVNVGLLANKPAGLVLSFQHHIACWLKLLMLACRWLGKLSYLVNKRSDNVGDAAKDIHIVIGKGFLRSCIFLP